MARTQLGAEPVLVRSDNLAAVGAMQEVGRRRRFRHRRAIGAVKRFGNILSGSNAILSTTLEACQEGTGMEPLRAEILTEEITKDLRGTVRRTLRLLVTAHASGDVRVAMILNISETGFLIEFPFRLDLGDTLHLELPEASDSTAIVIRTKGFQAGCVFVTPISKGAVSAARLKSHVEAVDSTYEVLAVSEDLSSERDQRDDAFQTAIVVITALVSALALLVFLAAILPL